MKILSKNFLNLRFPALLTTYDRSFIFFECLPIRIDLKIAFRHSVLSFVMNKKFVCQNVIGQTMQPLWLRFLQGRYRMHVCQNKGLFPLIPILRVSQLRKLVIASCCESGLDCSIYSFERQLFSLL